MSSLEKYHPLFETNLRALRCMYPGLADKIERLSPDPHFQWIESKEYEPTLIMNTIESDSPILFHSRHHPKQEAFRQIQSLNPGSPTVYFFAGLGLGYALESLWESYPRTINALFLVERDIQVFYYFLHRRDWSFLLTNPRVRIVVTEKPEKVITDAQPFLPQIMGSGIRFVDHHPSFQRHPAFYTATIEQFRQFLQRAAAESEFLIQQGALIQRNAILNLPAMCRSHGLGPLRGYFRNQPAVLIGAGPSLNRNLKHLIPERSKVLVFCVDTAYRLVRQQGIIPDFVAATDPTDLNVKHFEGVENDPREVLIFESDVHPSIPRRWKGSSIFLNSEKAAINRWIEEIAGPFGSFEQGLSVGHTLFNAADWMQCNPILLIGFDLAYPPEGGNTHAEGTIYNRKVQQSLFSEDRVVIQGAPFHPENSHEPIEWVLGVRGDRVPTSKTLAIFLRELSAQIRKSKSTVFDATEGGALIEGTIPTQLAGILATLEPREFPNDIVSFLEAHRDPQDIRRIRAFDVLLSGVKEAQNRAKTGMRLIEELRHSENPRSQISLQNLPEWKEIEQLFWNIYRDHSIQTALGQSLFSCLFLFIRQEKEENIQIKIQKYANVFSSINRLADEFIPFLEDSRSRIAQFCRSDIETPHTTFQEYE